MLPEAGWQPEGRNEPVDFVATVAVLIIVVFAVLFLLSFLFKTVRWFIKAAIFLAILAALAFLVVHLWD